MSQTQHNLRHRGGYTLIEMLLVVGILTVLGALVMPPALRLYEDFTLRDVVDRVQGELAGTRTRAIDAGFAYHFHYEPEGRWFVVVPSEYVREGADSIGTAGATAGGASSYYRAYGQLPEDMLFQAYEDDDDTTTTKLPEELFVGFDESNKLSEANFSAPLVFYPDGTGHDGRFVIKDESGQFIEVSVRGLTGGVTVSRTGREASR